MTLCKFSEPRRAARAACCIATLTLSCLKLSAQAPPGPIPPISELRKSKVTDTQPPATQTVEAPKKPTHKLCSGSWSSDRDLGFIERDGTRATVVAGGWGVALRWAVEALNKEYKWTVDYEQPVFNGAPDLCSLNSGSLQLDFTSFRASYLETRERMVSSADQERVLRKVVEAYNHSGNPGRFAVLKESLGHYAVVGMYVANDEGKLQKTSRLLGARVSIPRQRRNASETVQLVLADLFEQGAMAANGVSAAQLQGAGRASGRENAPAWKLLRRSLQRDGNKTAWTLVCGNEKEGPIPECAFTLSRSGNPPGPLLTERADPLSYQNSKYGISFRYPKNYVLTEDERHWPCEPQPTSKDEDSDEASQPWRVNVATVSMPKEAYPGTGFGEAFLDVSVNRVLTEETCIPDYSQSLRGSSKINNLRYTWTPWEGGVLNRGGGFSQSEYFTFANQKCYQITLYWDAVFSSDADGAPPILSADLVDVQRRLESILYTLQIHPVSSPIAPK